MRDCRRARVRAAAYVVLFAQDADARECCRHADYIFIATPQDAADIVTRRCLMMPPIRLLYYLTLPPPLRSLIFDFSSKWVSYNTFTRRCRHDVAALRAYDAALPPQEDAARMMPTR